MTDEQIIKATDVCRTPNTCRGCPYHVLGTAGCISILMKDVFDLINRQKAEIESLKQIIDEEDSEILELQKRIIFWREDLNYQPEKLKSEAIKEFAEQLKETAYSYSDISGYRSTVVDADSIDNLVKEMTEAQE